MQGVALSLALVLLAYLCGAVPFGHLVCRARAIDVRALGSGNIGATNVARVAGMRWGALVLLADMVKGLVPVLVISWQAQDAAAHAASWWVAAAMVAAVVGHVFSIFLRLRGGKGVATGLGVMLAVCPACAGLGVAVYVALYLVTRVSSVGSLGAAAASVLGLAASGRPSPVVGAAVLILGLIVARHRDNLGRVRRGEERGV